MSENSGKLQQRAELISILNKYVDETKINNKQLQNDIEIIQNFENKSLLFKTLLNEISSTDGIIVIYAQ